MSSRIYNRRNELLERYADCLNRICHCMNYRIVIDLEIEIAILSKKIDLYDDILGE